MRVTRYREDGQTRLGFYDEQGLVEFDVAARAWAQATESDWNGTIDSLLDLLPNGRCYETAKAVEQWLSFGIDSPPRTDLNEVQLLVPIPRPNKLFLLAGNYAAHIEEGGETASERAATFPYVFMKPPSTTLVAANAPFQIPSVSPQNIDWELELAVVIGRTAKGIAEADALSYVAGYTVINDISDRQFCPNPDRKPRERDRFFDWLHGKWHDGFCPCGPCIADTVAIPDPQSLQMKLTVNDNIKQDASTGQQIFPVAAVIEFISSFVTLEPGDIISTGTPAGVGKARGEFLGPGDQMVASIEGIGSLVTTVEAAAA
ncbi:MAG TPA: FAA hydrolase family protein [Planctomycetaceae bacterium]|nr:FAA hydrolase family protein [Planctomycetaceae bacterium]